MLPRPKLSHRSVMFALVVVSAAACSASGAGGEFENGSGHSDDGDDGDGDSGDTGLSPSSGSGTTTPENCDAAPDEDRDGDGFTGAQGDCNDCDPNANPDSVEVVVTGADAPPPADEDCNGMIDDVAPPCDDGLDVADPDPMNAARALDLCHDAGAGSWGVVEARYVRADGSPYNAGGLQHGLLSDFGPNVQVQRGARMLALSSGYARLPGQPGACQSLSCWTSAAGTPPPSFPADVPGCAGVSNITDDVGLELRLRAPKNATGYAFNFKFYSFEFAEWVCTAYNDQFIALVTPPPMGAQNGNIVFDKQNNPVSVNIAFFDVCNPSTNGDFAAECETGCPAKPSSYCPAGPAELVGNGFDNAFGSNEEDAGATVWLETNAPIGGGEEFTVRFAIWDTGDDNLDSSVLVDAFRWIASGGTVDVGTEPIPDPK